jgi:hypothetical protein
MEGYLPGNRVMAVDQSAGIVEKHFLRHPAEVIERRFDPVKPGRLPARAGRRARSSAANSHEQIQAHALLADRHARLTKIDPQLVRPASRSAVSPALPPARQMRSYNHLKYRVIVVPGAESNSGCKLLIGFAVGVRQSDRYPHQYPQAWLPQDRSRGALFCAAPRIPGRS